MEGHGTRRRRPRSRMDLEPAGRELLYDQAKTLAKQHLSMEKISRGRQQQAAQQQNARALEQSRKKSDRQVDDSKLTEERNRLVQNLAAQRHGRQPNMRQGAASPGTGQGKKGILGVGKKRGNPRRYLLPVK